MREGVSTHLRWAILIKQNVESPYEMWYMNSCMRCSLIGCIQYQVHLLCRIEEGFCGQKSIVVSWCALVISRSCFADFSGVIFTNIEYEQKNDEHGIIWLERGARTNSLFGYIRRQIYMEGAQGSRISFS